MIGNGVVGKATRQSLSIGFYYDLLGSNITLEEASKLKYVFLCLPTPTVKGQCQTEEIAKIIKQIRDYGHGNIFIIRSTVWPGFARATMKSLGIDSIVSVPEFLTQATWEQDANNPDIVVIGADNADYREAVENIYKARYQRSVDIITTDSVTAELIKWAINGFYATKIIYANEIYDFAQKVGANYETVKNTMYKRKWIGRNHLDVWVKGKRGAGGKCLSKDLEALAVMSGSTLLKKVVERNEHYRGLHE